MEFTGNFIRARYFNEYNDNFKLICEDILKRIHLDIIKLSEMKIRETSVFLDKYYLEYIKKELMAREFKVYYAGYDSIKNKTRLDICW